MSAEAVSDVIQSVAALTAAVNHLVAENAALRQHIDNLTRSVDQHDRRAAQPSRCNQSMGT